MDRKALLNATLIGTIAQLVMVVAGHFVPLVKDHIFAVGGMVISLLVGVWLARSAPRAWSVSMLCGAFAGGLCALMGILVSAALGDVPVIVAAFGTCASVVAGAAGGALGRVIAPKTA